MSEEAVAEVEDNRRASRFEVLVDGHLAELVYRRVGERLVLVHTGVPDALSGKGIGGGLVQAAVETARQEGLTLVPYCPFARAWLQRHPAATKDIVVDWPTSAT